MPSSHQGWSFNLRAYDFSSGSDSDNDGDGTVASTNLSAVAHRSPHDQSSTVSDDAQLLRDIDLSSRTDSAAYKPNPWTIAKVNATSRKHHPVDFSAATCSRAPLAKKKPRGKIVEAFEKQCARRTNVPSQHAQQLAIPRTLPPGEVFQPAVASPPSTSLSDRLPPSSARHRNVASQLSACSAVPTLRSSTFTDTRFNQSDQPIVLRSSVLYTQDASSMVPQTPHTMTRSLAPVTPVSMFRSSAPSVSARKNIPISGAHTPSSNVPSNSHRFPDCLDASVGTQSFVRTVTEEEVFSHLTSIPQTPSHPILSDSVSVTKNPTCKIEEIASTSRLGLTPEEIKTSVSSQTSCYARFLRPGVSPQLLYSPHQTVTRPSSFVLKAEDTESTALPRSVVPATFPDTKSSILGQQSSVGRNGTRSPLRNRPTSRISPTNTRLLHYSDQPSPLHVDSPALIEPRSMLAITSTVSLDANTRTVDHLTPARRAPPSAIPLPAQRLYPTGPSSVISSMHTSISDHSPRATKRLHNAKRDAYTAFPTTPDSGWSTLSSTKRPRNEPSRIGDARKSVRSSGRFRLPPSLLPSRDAIPTRQKLRIVTYRPPPPEERHAACKIIVSDDESDEACTRGISAASGSCELMFKRSGRKLDCMSSDTDCVADHFPKHSPAQKSTSARRSPRHKSFPHMVSRAILPSPPTSDPPLPLLDVNEQQKSSSDDLRMEFRTHNLGQRYSATRRAIAKVCLLSIWNTFR
ncbi:hypothetical protein SCP_0510650 [Sparassis crispa]|uniref:Uncharacterized protein n=1 Tax=Sparassis crispa TaxID=139825 RepID=A0A401GP68_9APHY|nr:hypothetical protein SCP_0510650 [Sparassis crispa]GBE84006.1 hypothetical protein SCP_0510650 [Sparassis crispa]